MRSTGCNRIYFFFQNSNLLLENQLSNTTQLQDILLSYHKTAFFFLRVTPLVSEASQYVQEKMLGSKFQTFDTRHTMLNSPF